MIVVRRQSQRGFEYSLSDETVEHIRANDMDAPDTRATIDYDVYDVFERFRGHKVETEVASLILRPRSAVSSLFNGSRVVDEDGKLLHQIDPGAESGEHTDPRVT